ncbi:MAG: bifunctional phosphoribosyl-AMP cyclohydrolase/phosphoribosyl-ATP diphosphatase HisIE [Deltaproteobacteria bacterium]|nr:bifunctional phosphoribosyl-AMP cyclohydrolase/phosphoribosyl-ATP diphosphatase HisIE [Deltaproteobacteria bacterium]
MDIADLKFDAAGRVAVVAQDERTGEVRMLAWADREALSRTLESGEAWFFSRSRGALWKKGESSGNTLAVSEVWADCDGDALIYRVTPRGPSCHEGTRSCFTRRLDASAQTHRSDAAPTLLRLTDTLAQRAESDGRKSYTRSLLDGGAAKIGAKLREEAGELADAIAEETDERVVSEAADLLYHAMVGLLSRHLSLADVAAELARRFDRSGHEEKAARR